ncbi:PREDICTED: uncharacterized protein LOC106102291 [Papilio polytes]|uniref:uncharacterized protein LOC106102291 n=1 Tax=Papilio polytes TaxID=76194 RepID=UPI000675D3A3|nr:PREDICTED: uncharacterized protein LOC106102291 [Papilio polytes]
MNIPEVYSYEERAINTVVSVINRAKEMLGDRQTLKQLANSRDVYAAPAKVNLSRLEPPLAITSRDLIADAIEKTWKLTNLFKYSLKYKGSSKDECLQYFYFEAIFSQPTVSYPIPQATASAFFRVQDKLIEPPETRGVPKMTFRVEGHHVDHDIRYVLLPADWLLAVIMMKVKLYSRIESYNIF